MQINWFTVAAQLINLLILAILLKKFLFAPIVKIMDERQLRIDEQENEALKKADAAEKKALELSSRIAETEAEKERVLSEARKKGEQEKKEYLNLARLEVEEQRRVWEQSLEKEKTTYFQMIQRQIGSHSCQISQKILDDLADEELENKIAHKFIRNIQGLDEGEVARIKFQPENKDLSLKIHGSFNRNEKIIKSISTAIEEKFGPVESIEYNLDSELICGFAIELYGYHLGWNIKEYLNDLENDLMSRLEHANPF